MNGLVYQQRHLKIQLFRQASMIKKISEQRWIKNPTECYSFYQLKKDEPAKNIKMNDEEKMCRIL